MQPFGLANKSGTDGSKWWNPSWQGTTNTSIANPGTSGGGMALGTILGSVAAPIIGGLFNQAGQREQRRGAQEALQFQQEGNQAFALAGFGAQELARDNELRRQQQVALNRLNLLESGPAQSQMRKQMGYSLAGQRFSPAEIAQFGSMFGGFA